MNTKRAKFNTLPIETLHRLLICDPVAGTLTWKARSREFFASTGSMNSWNAKHAGKPALASVSQKGYRAGLIFRRGFLAHRVIFAMATGAWPRDQIDHEYGTKSGDSLAVIREVTHMQNGRNQKRHSNNTSGFAGVVWDKKLKKWHSRIVVNYQRISLGWFDAKDDAIGARKLAEAKHGFHPNHGRGE